MEILQGDPCKKTFFFLRLGKQDGAQRREGGASPAAWDLDLTPRWCGHMFPLKVYLSPLVSSRGVAWTTSSEAVNWTASARPWWRCAIRFDGAGGGWSPRLGV